MIKIQSIWDEEFYKTLNKEIAKAGGCVDLTNKTLEEFVHTIAPNGLRVVYQPWLSVSCKEKKSSLIRKHIDELEKEYLKAKNSERLEILWDDTLKNEEHDTIGAFKLEKLKRIFTALNEGKELQFKHGVYGIFIVKMNPQRNSIIVNPETESYNSFVNANTIMNYITVYSGNWYIINE